MRQNGSMVVLALALGLPSWGGCYLFHGLDARSPDADPSPTPAPHDAGLPGRRDAGPPPTPMPIDGGPLPDDEPDVVPGERPSDDPSAGGWIDPPPAGSNPCCDVGEVIGLDDPERPTTRPVIAWNGREWGVAWQDEERTGAPDPAFRVRFRRLDRAARPTSAAADVPGVSGFPSALAWGGGRFGLLTTAPEDARVVAPSATLAVLDAEGRLVDWAPVAASEHGGALARYELAHGWAMATYRDIDGGGRGESRLVVYGGALDLRAERSLGETRYHDHVSLAIVSMKSSLVVAQSRDDGIALRTFTGGTLDEGPSALFDAGLALAPPRGTGGAAGALGATRFRDTVVVAANGSDAIRVAVFDPYRGALLGSPAVVGTTTMSTSPGIGADDQGGTIGICYPTSVEGATEPNGIDFVLIGPDGARIGAPVTIADGLSFVTACAVGASGRDEYTVVFLVASWSSPRHSIRAARVRVRR
ncbi:MAG: hypothetical protein M3Y87_27755 [Myxococcota bacterium]|nr:hypothetical protein [Myxococcota bacterium]